MKKNISITLIAVMLAAAVGIMGCAADPATQNRTMKGAALGAGAGAVAGALINESNRWQGGVIGAALGAALAGGTTYIASQASQQAVTAQQPVAYTNQAGQRVEAHPAGARSKDGCQTVREKYYDNGKLVKEVERTVCN